MLICRMMYDYDYVEPLTSAKTYSMIPSKKQLIKVPIKVLPPAPHRPRKIVKPPQQSRPVVSSYNGVNHFNDPSQSSVQSF